MLGLILPLAIAATVITVLAYRCAGISPIMFLRKTFAPLSKMEFWFPPCPFCWAARFAVAGLAVAIIIR